MTQNKNTYYFDAKEDNAGIKIAHTLSSFLNFYYYQSKDIVLLCIGSDRVTGDSLGPLIGYKMQNYKHFYKSILNKNNHRKLHLYGTLENPVHAMNLKETIEEIKVMHPSTPIIAIDASLGNAKYIGCVTVGIGALHPGTGVHKNLPKVGDIFITGIVGTAGMLEQMVLQTTRLSVVMSLADTITKGLTLLLSQEVKHFQ